ncbi:selenoprotein M isoform X2 [Physeter macrocephalus]|uniref:Selenoprotein M n=1 Tax=Physeter macrocephalus TaxID=9755 RepID=A0A2Y9SKN4_PHYMC|nr:selenoprotein M isoform X2 [Physeter catodon]|eukprot:XP_023976905.1 selenoprotein M isoform X2 [Physeter catodon]
MRLPLLSPPLLLLLAAVTAATTTFRPDWNRLHGLARGRVEVKAFVTQDIPLYHNLVMKHLPGADPELVLLGQRFEELERIPLSDMTREEINALVQELGFYRKASPDEPVPPEYLRAPARPAEGAPDRADL